jgi:predicted oxidoreductase (fatty acid repression mutant protein)
MASDPFFNALIARRTIYGISDASPIPDSRITEIVTKAIQHTPSSFNVQSARVVVLLKDEHKKFWDLAGQVAKESLPEAVSQSLAPRIEKFRGGYGSVCGHITAM